MSSIITGGGASVDGDVRTNGGDFAGRDFEQGKLLQNIVFSPPPPGDYPSDHPLRQYKLADVVAALIGDPMTGRKGLIEEVGAIKTSVDLAHNERLDLIRRIERLENTQYPLWFQMLMIVLAVALFVMLAFFLFEMRVRII